MAKLLGNLLWIQEKLLDQNADTKDILYSGKESSNSVGQSSDEDEEIPSDTEDEKSDNDDEKSDNDDEKSDNDDEKSNNEDDEDDNASNKDQVNGKQTEGSLKLPAKRKHELVRSLF